MDRCTALILQTIALIYYSKMISKEIAILKFRDDSLFICFYFVAKHSVCHILLNVAKVNSIENCCTVKTFCAFHLSWVLQIFPFPLELSCNTSRHFFFSRPWCGRCLSTKLWLSGQIPSRHRSQPRCSAHGLSGILPIRICNTFLDSISRTVILRDAACQFDGHTSSLTAFSFHFLSFQEQPLLYCIHSYYRLYNCATRMRIVDDSKLPESLGDLVVPCVEPRGGKATFGSTVLHCCPPQSTQSNTIFCQTSMTRWLLWTHSFIVHALVMFASFHIYVCLI